MKRLIICCDGTWNNPEQEDNGIPAPTNVYKIYNAIADYGDNNTRQLKYYHPGVGGEGGLLNAITGGAVGAGITRHICSAYHWLGINYEKGDEIYLFGFSRGAFTARSIGGFLGLGLLKLDNLDSSESWSRVHKAFEKGYRVKDSKQSDWVEPGWDIHHIDNPTPVRFIGVWDTVGALGIPDDLEILNLFDDKSNWEFYDTKLGGHVESARHAMALDEVRSSFCITRWENASSHKDAVELWFPGAHSDVGGGYADCDLSNGALIWMMEESKKAGLEFRPNIHTCIKSDPLGIMHNSYKGAFSKLRSRPRNIDAMIPKNKHKFHSSAIKRQKISPLNHPTYHPTVLLKIGDEFTVDVFADTRWNSTSVYLEKGASYKFTATGQWQDSKDVCDWKGTEDGKLTVGDIVRGTSSFLGKFENLFKKYSKNHSTDFWGTKRVENLKWFTLVGAIANDSGLANSVNNDGSPHPHQYVELCSHESKPLKIAEPGYLYCFANDVWSLYDNNRGSVQLTIHRVS